MSRILKWTVISLVGVFALILLASASVYLYKPGLRESWVKPGVDQEDLPAEISAPTAFKNVNVIPMDRERMLEAQTVVVEDGRITYIGNDDSEIPANAHNVDGTGKYLMPGLADMHTHVSGNENDLLLYVASGVTTIRTMGGEPPDILEWRDQIRAGSRLGPTVWAWWPSIHSYRGRDPEWLRRFKTRGGVTFVHTPEEVRQLVSELADLGVDGIKAHVIRSSDIYLALLESSAEHGLYFDGHAPGDYTYCDPEKAVCACTGTDCWEGFRTMHAPAIAHVQELFAIIDHSDVNPTSVSDERLRQVARDSAEDGMWVTTTLQRAYLSKSSDPEYSVAIERLLFELNESGGLLLAGTDAGTRSLEPGISLHDELEAMTKIGMSHYDALRATTYNPALFLGKLDESGTIDEGKHADLILLQANPLEDITNTRQLAGTMVQGRWYSRADLDLIREKVTNHNEATETTQRLLRAAFPIVLLSLMAGLAYHFRGWRFQIPGYSRIAGSR